MIFLTLLPLLFLVFSLFPQSLFVVSRLPTCKYNTFLLYQSCTFISKSAVFFQNIIVFVFSTFTFSPARCEAILSPQTFSLSLSQLYSSTDQCHPQILSC